MKLMSNFFLSLRWDGKILNDLCNLIDKPIFVNRIVQGNLALQNHKTIINNYIYIIPTIK